MSGGIRPQSSLWILNESSMNPGFLQLKTEWVVCSHVFLVWYFPKQLSSLCLCIFGQEASWRRLVRSESTKCWRTLVKVMKLGEIALLMSVSVRLSVQQQQQQLCNLEIKMCFVTVRSHWFNTLFWLLYRVKLWTGRYRRALEHGQIYRI